MKRLYLAFIIVIAILSFAGLGYRFSSRGASSESNKLSVVVTFYPLAEFSQHIGGDYIDVTTIVPPGAEPHDFEPTPAQLGKLEQSDVFIYNGAGFEGWVEKILPNLERNGVQVINASNGIPLIHESDHEGTINPHFWIDPVLAQQEVKNISLVFSEIDPANAHDYATNTLNYLSELAALDTSIRQGLQTCMRRDVVVAHDAFAYYGKQYNLTMIPIAGLSPEEEPSPQRMAEISRFAKETNITHIFFESLVNPRLSDTIAQEVGAQTLVFNPIEGLTTEQIAHGENYISVQKENLKNLRIALGC